VDVFATPMPSLELPVFARSCCSSPLETYYFCRTNCSGPNLRCHMVASRCISGCVRAGGVADGSRGARIGFGRCLQDSLSSRSAPIPREVQIGQRKESRNCQNTVCQALSAFIQRSCIGFGSAAWQGIDPADDTTEATILTSLAEQIESPVITAYASTAPSAPETDVDEHDQDVVLLAPISTHLREALCVELYNLACSEGFVANAD
jgi:hypothetical protein